MPDVPWMWDFDLLREATSCWLSGRSPYTGCGDNQLLYPLPVLYLLVPFALLPEPVAKIAWMVGMLLCLVLVLKRRALWYALSVPVLQVLYLGQLDLMFLAAVALTRNWLGVGLLTLKPQLIWLYLPLWFISRRRSERILFLLFVAVVYGSSLLFWPWWVGDWLITTKRLVDSAIGSPSFWGLLTWPNGWLWYVAAVLIGAFSVWWVLYRKNRYAATFAANPALLSYDLVLLLPFAKWWYVPLSWLCQFAANWMLDALPFLVLSVAVAKESDELT